jgi:hypothetical protein
MNITFACPQCDAASRQDVSADSPTLTCQACHQEINVPDGAIQSDGRLTRCLVCPSADLFVRKDFPQRLGVAIVVFGFVLSSIAWAYTQVELTFAILFATALVDVVLYLVVGDSLMCYRCHAEYRQVDHAEEHADFDLETHERYRQLEARTGGPQPPVSS